MQIINKFINPINWLIGLVLRLIIKKYFFKNVDKKDLNRLINYSLDLFSNETLSNIFKILLELTYKKPSELFQIKTINEILVQTLPLGNRNEIIQEEKKSIKYLFYYLILNNIFKKLLIIFKKDCIILLPFKLGVYSFIAFLFGIRVDYLLSLFDYFVLSIPSWTYNKLLELHFSWLSWLKNTLQINSITTDFNNNSHLPKINYSPTIINHEPEIEDKPKPETYLYLTKTQWLYLGISIIAILGAYFGYTGGIPFTKSFEFNSDNNPGNEPNNETRNKNEENNEKDENRGSDNIKGKRSVSMYKWNKETNKFEPKSYEYDSDEDLNNNEKDNEGEDIINQPKTWKNIIIDKIKNPFSWFKGTEATHPDELGFWKKRQEEAERLWRERLAYWESKDVDSEVKIGQLEKKGSLGELDRNDVRKEYIENKNSSPTHPDPELEQERNKLFPKSTLSSSQLEKAKEIGRQKAESFYESLKNNNEDNLNSRDSLETVRPGPSGLNNTPEIRKEIEQDIEERHTYPPRPLSNKLRRGVTQLRTRFSSLSNTPFARGFNENLDPNNPIPTPISSPVEPKRESSTSEPTIEIEKGSLMLGANFLDNFDKGGWRD